MDAGDNYALLQLATTMYYHRMLPTTTIHYYSHAIAAASYYYYLVPPLVLLTTDYQCPLRLSTTAYCYAPDAALQYYLLQLLRQYCAETAPSWGLGWAGAGRAGAGAGGKAGSVDVAG